VTPLSSLTICFTPEELAGSAALPFSLYPQGSLSGNSLGIYFDLFVNRSTPPTPPRMNPGLARSQTRNAYMPLVLLFPSPESPLFLCCAPFFEPHWNSFIVRVFRKMPFLHFALRYVLIAVTAARGWFITFPRQNPLHPFSSPCRNPEAYGHPSDHIFFRPYVNAVHCYPLSWTVPLEVLRGLLPPASPALVKLCQVGQALPDLQSPRRIPLLTQSHIL